MEEAERAWFWLSLDGNTPDDDVLWLIEALTDQEKGIRVPPTGGGPGLGDIVLCATAFAVTTTTLANQVLDIAEKLGRFRKRQHEHGNSGRVRVERSNGDRIEIEGYSAEEILPILTTAMFTPQAEDQQEPEGNALPEADVD